jgi:hypothetical protein
MPGAHLSKKVVRCSESQRKLHEVHAGPQRFLGHKLGGMHAVNPGQYSASGWMSRAARRAAVMICEHCYNFLKVEPDLCRGAGAGCVGHWAVLEALGSARACGGGACLTKLAPKVATGCSSISSADNSYDERERELEQKTKCTLRYVSQHCTVCAEPEPRCTGSHQRCRRHHPSS